MCYFNKHYQKHYLISKTNLKSRFTADKFRKKQGGNIVWEKLLELT